MVLREMGPVAANAALLTADIAALNADGCTPLSESMYEAYLYLSGGRVDYGINSRKSPTVAHASVLSSRQPAPNTAIYKSPITISCQQNFIVLLTDGLPTADNSANPEIQALIGGTAAPGTGDGRCLEEIARVHVRERHRPTLAGDQNVTTYTVGFGPEVAGSAALQNTAVGAGGVFYEANDTASLSTVFAALTRDILAFNTSFTAPAVSVNAFNRTQNLNDLYVTVFRPSETYFWDGNIKKYKLTPLGVIEDVNDDPAVDVTTGFFRETSQSFWSRRRGRRPRYARRRRQRAAGSRSAQGVQRHQHRLRLDRRGQRGREHEPVHHDRHARARRRRGAGAGRIDRLAARHRHLGRGRRHA